MCWSHASAFDFFYEDLGEPIVDNFIQVNDFNWFMGVSYLNLDGVAPTQVNMSTRYVKLNLDD